LGRFGRRRPQYPRFARGLSPRQGGEERAAARDRGPYRQGEGRSVHGEPVRMALSHSARQRTDYCAPRVGHGGRAMRTAFLQALLEEARRDARVVLVNPDTVGFYCERFRRELPGQYLNAGIAEQNAVGVSAGLALTGRRPFLFNILAFNSFRCYEQIRLDVCAMDLSLVLVGVGAGIDYGAFGPSHHTMEDVALMRALPGMAVWSPADKIAAASLVPHCIEAGGPAYLRLHRTDERLVYRSDAAPELSEGLAVLRPGRDLLLAATGPMVLRAMEVAEALSARSIDVGVVDVFRLKPFPEHRFVELAKSFS